jgi:S-methylmethionine-dependent homocysteine/selenocysteine methylase
MAISGNIGPCSDEFVPEMVMSPEEAQEYHQAQVAAFASVGADVVTAVTLNYINKGIRIVKAAQEVGIPVIFSPLQ